jgi:hypothetical protein
MQKQMNSALLFSRSLAVLLSCSLAVLLSCSKPKAACEIGSFKLTTKDIEQRAKVSEVYYPGSGKPYVGLAQLIKGYLALEIMKSLGIKVDDSVLDQEGKRIDDNTKAPEVLKQVKRVFGSDQASYRRVFLAVVFAERVLYNEIFMKSREIHKEASDKAESLVRDAGKSPEKFREISSKLGLDVKKVRLSLKDGIVPEGMKDRPEGAPKPPGEGAGQDQAQRLIEYVKNLKPGQVTTSVIEWMEGYQVMKFIGRGQGEDYLVETVSVQKRDYDGWFWDKAREIRVKIYDEKLKTELLKEVSWTKNLYLK